jgi:hypothetical protein
MQESLSPKLGMPAQGVKQLRENFPDEQSLHIPHNRNRATDRADYARSSDTDERLWVDEAGKLSAMSGPQTHKPAQLTHSPHRACATNDSRLALFD